MSSLATEEMTISHAGIPWGRWLVGLGALAVSTLLHFTLIERLPDLPVGRTPEIKAYERARAVTMRDVAREPVPTMDRPPEFRPEDPSRIAPIPEQAEEFLKALEPVMPEPGRGTDEAFAMRDATLEDAGRIEQRAAWEPRQDIMKIEERRVREDLAVIPRKFAPVVPRVPDAPDIVLPDAPSLPEVASDVLAALPARAGPVTARSFSPDAAGLLPDVSFSPLEEDELPVGPDAPDLMAETLEDVAAFEPVEQLLLLDIRTYRPDDEEGVTYFQINIRCREDAALPVLPRDVLIMQDCSESMTQRKLNSCKTGLYSFLDTLSPNDRIEVLAFREKTVRCFEAFAPAGFAEREKAEGFIKALKARGKTDVYESLQELVQMPRESGRPIIAVLVTDGRPTTGIVDSSDIIEGFTRQNAGGASVFGLGGGKRVNRFLLDMLSYRNRGDSKVEQDRRRIPEVLSEMAADLRRPVLKELTYRFSGIEDKDIFPSTLTHLFLDRPLVLYGRVGDLESEAAFQIVGDDSAGRRDMVFPIDWSGAVAGDSEIRRQWAWHLIFDLIGEYTATKRPDLLERVHAVARRHGLRVPYGKEMVLR
jgi:uncharacterized protein YegL